MVKLTLLLLLAALSSLAYGQIVLNRTTMTQDIAIDVVEGQSVMFVCEAFATLSTRQPGSSFGTNRPDNLMPLGALTPGFFTFDFQNVSRSDNGIAFMCSGAGGMTDIGIIIVLFAPNYTNPGPQTVTEDETNIQLNVSVDANPFPSFFNWSRNGALITSSGNVALTADSITFTRVQRSDAGTYTVFSSNTAGSDSTSFELTVQFPPAVGIGAGNLSCNNDVSICAIMTGANGYLECTTVGVPTPNLTLTTAAAVSNNVMLNGSRVMITTAVARNAGTYTCNASNFLNFDEQTFQLQVGGAPDVNDLIINVTSDTQVLITWMFSNSGVPVDPFEVTTTCPNFQPPASRVDVPRMGYEVTFTQDIPPTIPGGTECRVIVRVTNLLGSDTVENMFIVSGATMMTTSGGAAFSAAISVLLLILTSLVL